MNESVSPINSKILACGSYLPKKLLTNTDLEKMVETTDQWIIERTGIKQRHIAALDELPSDMACAASLNAIAAAKIQLSDIDMIIVATTTPDLTFPATATIVQSKLGIKQGFAFDIQAVCSGFVYALTVADKFIKTGQVKNALVIGVDLLSRIVNWQDRGTCVLFGDGAGAVILSANHNINDNSDILATELHSDGSYTNILCTDGGVASSGKAGHIQMNGKEVFRQAVEKMSEVTINAIAKAGFKLEDINWLIAHQANSRILTAVAKKLNFSEEKLIITVDQHANTSAATIPLALDYALQAGKIKRGDLIALTALGGGISWGAIILRW